ncbi:FxSxx-COOH system tetratricopeptide repeat protein [Frankia sp. R43]|uniref:FxSxx-COOH system tetratricopeptide repeat protein n=1 Tax=Frankia sp. R43 TaxID=269536 RepID=UPI000AD0D0FA|nr:FxSxx-COOH system tetratricopeptide repeat protein [Frankia sp. R43]
MGEHVLGWRWDVALSYASAQRGYVERVAAALKERGVRCFFDADEQVELWGRLLAEELPRVYSVEAALAVLFVSADYAARDWTNVERRAALRRAARERREYLLPARFDDTRLPGLRADLVAVDLSSRTPEQFAEMIVAKLDRLGLSGVRKLGDVGSEKPRVWNLPSRLRTFTGRQDLLRQIGSLLGSDGSVALVQPAAAALHGLGGVGKTQLAIEYCYRYADSYDVVWWVDSEEPALIADKIAPLAQQLGLASLGAVDLDAAAALDSLRHRDRWLLVFDNAVRPEDINHWIPGGSHGHILVTSRNPTWGAIASRVAVDVLPQSEALALLQMRIPNLEKQDAIQLATELGGLPLALEQAAAYIERTQVHPTVYLRRFRDRRSSMLSLGEDLAYGGTVDTAWSLTLAQLDGASPATIGLLRLCALLAPEPVPLNLFTEHPELLPDSVRSIVENHPEIAIDEQVAVALSYSMCQRHGDSLQVHRLVQTVISGQLSDIEHSRYLDSIQRLLAAAAPSDADDPATWPKWSMLGAHLLAVVGQDDGRSESHDLRQAVDRFCWHLYTSGDYQAARHVNGDLLGRYRAALGLDHPDTLSMANNLSVAVRALGDFQMAEELDRDTLARCKRSLGPDHPATLRVTNDLAADLSHSDPEVSRDIHKNNLAACRRVLGEDHPRTINSANNLAIALRELGDFRSAYEIDRQAVSDYRRIYPEGHPVILISLCNNALDLQGLGRHHEARRLHEDVLAQRMIYLGRDHPVTLRSQGYLADAMRKCGEMEGARILVEDTLKRRLRVLGEMHPHTRASREMLEEMVKP